MYCLAFQIPQYAQLHLPKLGFFQYFLVVPKPHLTLRMGVVSFWATNLSRIWKWRGRSWGKTIMDCVENYGYNNLSFSRIVARVFALRSTPQHIWVMWVYIVWVETGCIKYDKIAKQNVLWVSCGKASPARHSWKPAVTILSWLFAFQLYARHMLHFAGRLLASYPQKLLWSSIVLSLHTLSHTQPLQ